MLQNQVIAEIKQIPPDRLIDVYQLIHYFCFEWQNSNAYHVEIVDYH